MISIGDVTDVLAREINSVLTWEKVRDIVSELLRMDDEWEPMEVPVDELGYTMSTLCPDICRLAEQAGRGYEFRFLRRMKRNESNAGNVIEPAHS